MVMDEIIKKLFDAARQVRERAYAPYSHFKVGAAVLTSKGDVYAGCNVESVTFTLTTHAEMNAIDSAVAAGDARIEKILIVLDSPAPVFPCALCRQKIIEFSDNAEVIAATLDGNFEKTTITKLYPKAFTPKELKATP